MGWKYDGWLPLDVEKRCSSESNYEKKNATTEVFQMQRVIMKEIAVFFYRAVEN